VDDFLTDNVMTNNTSRGWHPAALHHWKMAKFLHSWPKYDGYLGIVVPVQAINGQCLKCGYRLAWVLANSSRGSDRGKALI
jgi:hypothetical protein